MNSSDRPTFLHDDISVDDLNSEIRVNLPRTSMYWIIANSYDANG